jgi:hypothetical protein
LLIYNLELLRASEGTLSRWFRLNLQSLAPIKLHWARVVGYGPFSLWVIHKEGLCPSSGELNRLMMRHYWICKQHVLTSLTQRFKHYYDNFNTLTLTNVKYVYTYYNKFKVMRISHLRFNVPLEFLILPLHLIFEQI